MKKLLSGILASALAASMAFADIAVANAMAPMVTPAVPAATQTQDVQQVDDIWRQGRYWRNMQRRGDRQWRGDRRWRGDGHWNGRRDFARRDWRARNHNYRYWNGHRGYRHWRRGYREYNGWWFPLAAFTAGAVISGALNDGTPVYRGGNRHVQWCYNRYRSYRASDNTFQPYNGPRRQCYSPYR